MVKGHTSYVKIYDARTQTVNTSTSIQGQELRIPQQSVVDHSQMMGQDGAWKGTLPPYLSDCGT
jgi:hypothetical protein